MHSTHCLIPGGRCYVRDLCIRQLDGARHIAAWVEQDACCRVAWCLCKPDGLGSIQRAAPLDALPTLPCAAGRHIVWCEMTSEGGRLAHLRLGAGLRPAGSPKWIPVPTPGNLDAPACALDPEGNLWVVAERWTGSTAAVVGLKFDGESWTEALRVENQGFAVRPRLAAGPGGQVLASWDSYSKGAYRVVTAFLPHAEQPFVELPAPAGTWETLSAVAAGPGGTWYAARCREHLVELEGGICSRHSRLVVARLRTGRGTWQDIGEAEIDHAMNPWMAAYCGRRRFPALVPDEGGTWLLWEEKEDVKAVDPPAGRLCALHMTGNETSTPIVLVPGRGHFVTPQAADPQCLAVISRERPERFVERYPTYLHWCDLTGEHPARPENLATNSRLPPFPLRPPTPAKAQPGAEDLRLFFGDLHLHSRMSQDLDGEQDELYHVARDIARLDFAAFTENDFHHFAEALPEVDWRRNQRNAEAFNEPGRFTTFHGWEFTGMRHPGTGQGLESHRCVIFPGADPELFPWYAAGEVRTPPDLARHFRNRRVLLHHHHPNGYDITDDSVERNIEVCSGWWNCMENETFVRNLHRLLSQGHRLGFIGASDNHERNPGLGGALTGVWATENTRDAIFDAIWNRRVFATTGCRPAVRFDVSGIPMGAEGRIDTTPLARLRVEADSPIILARVLRDGNVVHEATPRTPRVALRFEDVGCQPGPHVYYAHIRLHGHEVNPFWNTASAVGISAWTSPVWVHAETG